MFELKLEGKDGALFHMRMPGLPKMEEVQSLTQLAYNTAGLEVPVEKAKPVYNTPMAKACALQKALGENKQESIDLGEYKEPTEGVRVRILSFPTERPAMFGAIKDIRANIPISMFGLQHILMGNIKSPVFSQKDADLIMSVLKTRDIHAKIVSMSE